MKIMKKKGVSTLRSKRRLAIKKYNLRKKRSGSKRIGTRQMRRAAWLRRRALARRRRRLGRSKAVQPMQSVQAVLPVQDTSAPELPPVSEPVISDPALYQQGYEQSYQEGFNVGFSKGFEDGLRLAYQEQEQKKA